MDFASVANSADRVAFNFAFDNEFRVAAGVLCLLDERGALVLPVSFDYLQWTEPVARVAEAFADPSRRNPDVKSVVLWTDGQVSARAQAELRQRNVGLDSSVKLAGK